MHQLELFEIAIGIRIISDQGHQTFYLAPCDVKEFISKHSKKLGLWLYIDGIQTDLQRIEKSNISLAKEIILTRALVGG